LTHDGGDFITFTVHDAIASPAQVNLLRMNIGHICIRSLVEYAEIVASIFKKIPHRSLLNLPAASLVYAKDS